jgi:hypothetical protein
MTVNNVHVEMGFKHVAFSTLLEGALTAAAAGQDWPEKSEPYDCITARYSGVDEVALTGWNARDSRHYPTHLGTIRISVASPHPPMFDVGRAVTRQDWVTWGVSVPSTYSDAEPESSPDVQDIELA